MTEIPGLSALFGGQQPQPTPEQLAHAEKVHRAMHEAEQLAFAQVQFFAPVLCSCARRYDREDPGAPQAGCVVHGHLQLDAETGRVLVFRPPRHW